MAWPIFAAARLAGKAVPAGVYKAVGLLAIGVGIGIWVALKTLVPPPSVQIEYITRVIEAQEPLQEIVVRNAVKKVEIEIVEKIVEKEVVRYVEMEIDPVACNVPIGSVRMLNDARSGELRPDGVQSPTAEIDDEGRAPSTVTRADLFRSDASIAIEYNKCRNQLNSLIDWIDIQQSSLDR